MKWVTRRGIRVNRTATCWLIRRFLDPEAEFLFIPAEQVCSIFIYDALYASIMESRSTR